MEIRINENDKVLYEYLKHCKDDEQIMKNCLTLAVELYNFCTGGYDICGGHLSPEAYREQDLKQRSTEELKKLKASFEKEVLSWATCFDPDSVDCGVMRGPEEELWFVEESSPLGFITLYSGYIKEIDSLLNERGEN